MNAAFLYGLLCMVGYGLSLAVIQPAIERLGAVRACLYRSLVSAVFLLGLFPFFSFNVSWFFVAVSLGIGFFGYVPYYFFLKALQRGKVGVLAPIGRLSTIVTIILSIVFFHETLTFNQFVAVLIIILGAVLITVNVKDVKQSLLLHKTSGIPLAFFCALLWGVVYFVMKFSVTWVGALFASFLLELGVFVASVFHSFFTKKADFVVSRKYVFLIIVSGITSGLGSAAYALGIEKASVSLVTAIASASPVVAALYGWFVFKHSLSFNQMVGIVFIVLGTIALQL